ncbi:hypothetical protein BJY52DRAFT_1266399 [Lactarius psammicola]|nr:hypothetical protein BJY52DRAFT_1266399 [Lactarius psammicola]
MSQIAPQLSYPGGCSAFFTDLHLDFSRWLRLVALVPLVHASIEGIYYEELCSHLLDILPSSNPSNILAVSVERIRSSVSEMLFEEPFFVCPFSDSKLLLSTSRWIYEPSLDSEPSRISFAFRILRCVSLFPNWSAYDLLSRIACGAHPRTLPFTASNVLETCRQRDRLPSGSDVFGTWSPRSTSVPPVRVPISLLIGTSVSPMRVGQDPPNQLESSFSSGSEPTTTSGPLHLPRSLYLRPGGDPDAIGSKLSEGNFDFGTNQLPRHLSGPYEVPLRSFVSPGLSVVHSHSAGADSAIDSQQYNGVSDFPVLLGQLPSFSSAGYCDLSENSCAKIPLFLPSQTPNRDPSPRGTLSSQASGLRDKRTSPLDQPHTSPLCTSALQNVDANKLEEAVSLHDGRSLHATRFTIAMPAMSPWINEPGSDDRPRTPVRLNHGPPRYRSAERSGSLGRRDKLGSGCATNKTKSSKRALHAQGDSGPDETSVPKRTKRIATPVRATIQDVPFYTPSVDLTLTPSLLTPLDFGDHEELSHVEGTQTHTSKPSTASESKEDTVVPRQSCTLITPPSAPHSDLGQNPPFSGACRPSVIVYKVARGPNLARSRDVVRISYGEGHQKRTRMKFSGRRNKRGDAAMQLDKKSKADIKAQDKSLPAERIEGDMAWDFGVGSEMGGRGANVHRPQVRVGGLTSVRMIPRTAVDGEVGSRAFSPSASA